MVIQNPKFKIQNSKGFTLLELMFVVGLMIMLATISVPMTLGFFNERVLEESAQALKNNIKATRSRAINGKGDGFWGVRFEEDKYIVFEGKSFEDRNKVNDKRINLPGGMNFERPGREIVFEKNSGDPFYDPSLVGHWEMDAGEGCMAYDYSGLGNHGLLNPDCSSNSPSWVEDKDGNSGRALEFDGSDDYMDADQAIDGKSDFTFTWWFKTNNPHTGTSGNFVGQRVNESGSQPDRLIYNRLEDDGTTISFGIRNEDHDIYYADANGDFTNGEWYHVATQRINDEMKVYINGKLEAHNSSATADDVVNPDQILRMGAFRESSELYEGKIDNVRIYDRALSEIEINNLYQGQGDLQLNFQGNSVELEVDEQGNVSID